MDISSKKNKNQKTAPIFEALVEYRSRKVLPLHTPGHKGIGYPQLKSFLTDLGLACDLPSMDATDNSFHPSGCISHAQNLAAELYNAGDSFYLVNGATIGIHAAFMAAVKPGDKILLPRNFHISVFAALVFCGATPIYMPTKWLDGAGPIPPLEDEFREFFKKNKDIRAVFLTHPTYYGVGRPLNSISNLCHRYNIPLIVDEAHGSHFHFLPKGNINSALDYGADVVIQSAHKILGSLVGTAQMHRGKDSLISKERLQLMLNLFQSTSSNYLLLSSLDIIRSLMYQKGNQLFSKSVKEAESLRKKLDSIHGIKTLSTNYSPALFGCDIDPLRLTINVSNLGISGFQTELLLYKKFNILDEFCDNQNVVFVLSPNDSLDWYDKLVNAFQKISTDRYHLSKNPLSNTEFILKPNVTLTPREATFKQKIKIPLNKSIGCISGELITSYPPGIPIICPGEEITEEIVNYCQWLSNQSSCIFAEDKTLSTISILNV